MTTATLARQLGLSITYVEGLMKLLKRGDLLQAHRGPGVATGFKDLLKTSLPATWRSALRRKKPWLHAQRPVQGRVQSPLLSGWR